MLACFYKSSVNDGIIDDVNYTGDLQLGFNSFRRNRNLDGTRDGYCGRSGSRDYDIYLWCADIQGVLVDEDFLPGEDFIQISMTV